MDEPIEIRVTVHWPDDGGQMGNRLYTLRARGHTEYVALLQRLAKYAYQEERCLHHTDEDTAQMQHEKEALEWRLNNLNRIMAIALEEKLES